MESDINKASPAHLDGDMVTLPSHYMKNGMECKDWIRSALTEEEYRGYLKGCLLKYFWRYESKGNPVQDLEKLQRYADFLIEELEESK